MRSYLAAPFALLQMIVHHGLKDKTSKNKYTNWTGLKGEHQFSTSKCHFAADKEIGDIHCRCRTQRAPTDLTSYTRLQSYEIGRDLATTSMLWDK